jgi:hypothetical protein
MKEFPEASIENIATSDRAESQDDWVRWQADVLESIQSEFCGVIESVGWDDVDWGAWRPLFDQGYSAREAVHQAFGRVA